MPASRSRRSPAPHAAAQEPPVRAARKNAGNSREGFGRGSWIRTNDLQYPKLPRYQAALYPDASERPVDTRINRRQQGTGSGPFMALSSAVASGARERKRRQNKRLTAAEQRMPHPV